jgi:competence protein ComEA
MRRRACLLTLLGLSPWAASGAGTLIEVNSASRAQLESLAGLGPALVDRILQARQRAEFRDWQDLRQRVRGLGTATLLRLSEQGLRVAGQAYTSQPPDAAASASGESH